jgi:hypothetical protein
MLQLAVIRQGILLNDLDKLNLGIHVGEFSPFLPGGLAVQQYASCYRVSYLFGVVAPVKLSNNNHL